ncbi:hypothetical protein EDB80DRAFT_805562 [Ilyonectria destructans]|nr:hypothetical protein EDB80DRAFT_805562 [Ilyonectria destructans]
MPGVPTSRGCSACRKQKKKASSRNCDQAKPTCGRCTRRGIPCVGNGVQRWKFHQKNFRNSMQLATVTDTPRPSLSNETTKVASSFVHILGVEDVRYNIRSFGGQFFLDLPRRVGSNPALDLSVSALVASFNTHLCKHPKVDALAVYGDALEALRMSLANPAQSIGIKIYTIFNIYICQGIIDPEHNEIATHRLMLANLVQDAVSQGRLKEINSEYMSGICQIILWESMINRKVQLGQWFWEALSTCSKSRPHEYQQGRTFMSLDIGVQAEAASYLREPERYIDQIQSVYDLMQLERPTIRNIVQQYSVAAMASSKIAKITEIRVIYQIGYAHLLSLGARLNGALRKFNQSSEHIKESHEIRDEAIILASQCGDMRPFGISTAHCI